MINRRQSPSEMVWRFICCCNCDTKPDVFCGRCHSRNYSQGFIHWPLRAGNYRGIEISRAFVDIVASYSDFSLVQLSGWALFVLPRTSAMKIPWNLADSKSCANSTQWSTSLKRCDSSSGCLHSPGDWCPLPINYQQLAEIFVLFLHIHISTKAFRMSDLRGFSVDMVIISRRYLSQLD